MYKEKYINNDILSKYADYISTLDEELEGQEFLSCLKQAYKVIFTSEQEDENDDRPVIIIGQDDKIDD
ncbi:MAG: hypothetical protein U1E31_02530 [Rickettsiales bacterium]